MIRALYFGDIVGLIYPAILRCCESRRFDEWMLLIEDDMFVVWEWMLMVEQ
jgi:hypothetical protein